MQRLEELISAESLLFKAEIDRTVEACLPQYEAALKQYELELAEWQRTHPNTDNAAINGTSAYGAAGQATSTPATNVRVERANSLTPVASDGDASMADKSAVDAAATKTDEAPKRPKPRFKWTDVLRTHLYTIMTYQTEIVTRQKEKARVTPI